MGKSNKNKQNIIHGSSENIGFLLTRSASLWNEVLMQELGKLGFENSKPSHGSVLIPIFDSGEQSITTIMKYSKLKKQTMTTYIKELLILGLIKQREDPADKRSKLITLTKLGEELKFASENAVEKVNDRFRSIIRQSEFDNLQKTLYTILNSFD